MAKEDQRRLEGSREENKNLENTSEGQRVTREDQMGEEMNLLQVFRDCHLCKN